MADGSTTNYGFIKPEVGASGNTWGGKLNSNADDIDALIKAIDFLTALNKANPILADRVPIIDTETDPDTTKYITFTQLKALILAAVSLADNIFEIVDNADATKKLVFQVSGVTAGQTRTLTIPDLSGTVALLTGAQTFTDKTLTQPVIILKQGAAEAPTAEGDIRWDTDDNVLLVGDGAATQIFAPIPSGMTADDLIGASGAKSFQRIPKGTFRQFLRMNGAGDGQEWAGSGFLSLETGNLSGKGSTLNVDLVPGITEIAFRAAGLSWNGTVTFTGIRLGDSGGVETNDYEGWFNNADGYVQNSSIGAFGLFNGLSAGNALNVWVRLIKISSIANTWEMTGKVIRSDGGGFFHTECQGYKITSGEITTFQVCNDGADTFDAGTYELAVKF